MNKTTCRTPKRTTPAGVSWLLLVVSLGLCACSKPASEPVAQVDEPAVSETRDERLDWFKEAKYGLFIHWGLYAAPGGQWGDRTDHAEWLMLTANIKSDEYSKLADDFNPTAFDADAWAKLAYDAGMKYIVITAKHHDGFSMYDSAYTDYDIVDATPFKRDPIRELAEAAKSYGLKFAVYYSVVDWYHPEFPAGYSQIRAEYPTGFHGAPNPDADILKYNEFMRNQVSELLTNYGDIAILWFDGGGSFRNRNRYDIVEGGRLLDLIRTKQPSTLINDRLGFGSDYGTPEQKIPGSADGTAFEVCMTLNGHWGYNSADDDWKSPREVVQNLVDIASKGGNYLLNVGPDGKGAIPGTSQSILREAGAWLSRNGESIYGTIAGNVNVRIRGVEDARITSKGNTDYVHLFTAPEANEVFIEGQPGLEVSEVYFLAEPDTKLDLVRYERGLSIHIPDDAPSDPYSTVLVVKNNPSSS